MWPTGCGLLTHVAQNPRKSLFHRENYHSSIKRSYLYSIVKFKHILTFNFKNCIGKHEA